MIICAEDSFITLSFRISDFGLRICSPDWQILPESFYPTVTAGGTDLSSNPNSEIRNPKFEIRNSKSEIHLTTSYALTFRESSARQMAQITKSAAHEHHRGGSFMTISRTNWPSISVTRPVVRTNVPNK